MAVTPGSLLHRLVGRHQIAVNSVHHQAVRRLPPDFVAAAHAPDGVLEAFAAKDCPFCLAVPWHPEELAAAHPEHAALFAALADASRRPR